MKVRASFCVSKVGTIVSSSGEPLGLGAGVGMSVCAGAIGDRASTQDAINKPGRLWQIRVRVIQVIQLRLVIPSEAEGSHDILLGLSRGIPRLRFASLGMTANFGDTADKSMPLQKAVHALRQ